MSVQPTMTATEVRKMIDRGVPHTEIVGHLESTGVWSQAGAREIVRFMATGPDSLLAKHVRLVRHAPPQRTTSTAQS